MIKLLSLSMTMWKNNRKKLTRIFAIIIMLTLTIMYMISTNRLSTSDYITYYTFMIGFHMQSYVSVSMTQKADLLKKIDEFGSITKIYKSTILINLIGLVTIICNIALNLHLTVEISEVLKIDIMKGIEFIPLCISIYFLIILINSLIKFFNYMEPNE